MFVEVFESVAWTQTLLTSLRRQSSYARNSLRKDVRHGYMRLPFANPLPRGIAAGLRIQWEEEMWTDKVR